MPRAQLIEGMLFTVG